MRALLVLSLFSYQSLCEMHFASLCFVSVCVCVCAVDALVG
jgi:hypothetical protein